MNRLKETTDLDKLRFLKTHLPKEHLEAYKEDFETDKGVSCNYFNFVPFCHTYADYLLQNGLYDIYGSFIDEFNKLIENDKNHKFMKKIQDTLISSIGGLAFLNTNYNNVLIRDKRPAIRGQEFSYESDLERIIVSELKDYFLEEIDVKRQQKHGYGHSDITINDEVAIELKKSSAKRKDVYQTFEYSFDEKLKAVCLIAKNYEDKVLSIANKLGVSCYTYSFMYEENSNKYPRGFVIEKVNHTPKNLLDEYLETMDNCFWITFYDPSFKVSEIYEKHLQMVVKINDLTAEICEKIKSRIFSKLEKQGIDTSSQTLEQIIEEAEQKGII